TDALAPLRAARHRICTVSAIAALTRGQYPAYEIVHDKASGRFIRRGSEVPRARALAHRVPGPHGRAVDALHQLRAHRDAAVMTCHRDPVAVRDAQRRRRIAVDVKEVLAVDLSEPGVVRSPAMIH